MFRKKEIKIPPLVIKQHIHAARAISSFCDEDNLVDIKFKNNNQTYRKGKKAKIFTTSLTWDQKSELGYMRIIEKDFLNVLLNLSKAFSERDHVAITKYALLWQLRFNFFKSLPKNEYFGNLSPLNLSEEQKNQCDRMGIYYHDNGDFASIIILTILV